MEKDIGTSLKGEDVEITSDDPVVATGEEGEELEEEAVADKTVERHENVVDLDTMKRSVWFLFEDRNQKLSQFWILIILASIIATMGVSGDSPATVIGAMSKSIVRLCLCGLGSWTD